ncbi:FecCD family ABC transporter permease [Nocardioides nitrophenolicus]|uniref:FecCD family ABC transporter permease n=1 Tax=Nocardioides nitrophenolicus TaxID=60489 RepID=UPI00195B87D9|nr:iron ABC transporter permease [Nocardioides nitrophenolicus]MBM7517270.1 iron complex transport system permease protein [Nocardioides nitrophenolicus]
MIIIPNSIATAVPRSSPAVVLTALGLAAAGCLLAALCVGHPVLAPGTAVAALLDPDHPQRVTVGEVRLPRAVLGAVAGGGLGLSGLLLQDALRNPIAGPELLGVSSGAAVVVATIVVLGLGVPLALQPWLALAGALVAGAGVLLAMGRTRAPDHVVLVGAAVSAACGGLVVAVVGLGTQGNVVVLFRYLMGSLAARGWSHVATVAPLVAAGILVAWLIRRRVEALTLGDEVAAGLGVAVARTRVLAVGTAALLAAAVASACGPVAWVALLAPHLARRLTGSASTRRALAPTLAVGGLLLMAADLGARRLLYPVEVPVGIVTTLVGVPALLLLRPTGRPR